VSDCPYQTFTRKEIDAMRERYGMGRIVIDDKGTEMEVEKPWLPPTPEENIIAFPDKKEIRVDWRQTFGKITELQEHLQGMEIAQEEGTYNLNLERPDIRYGLAFLFSDAHIGSLTSDHTLIQKVLDLSLKLPNTCIIDNGDTFDNGIWGGLQFEQAIPPYAQAFTLQDIARELGEKYAAVVIGNHPEWMFYHTGVRPEDLFYRQVKGPIFPGMGLLHLNVGEQSYKVALSHTYWGKSKINIHNCCVRLREKEYPDADVFVVGHEHIWGHMKEMINNREVLYCRPGTGKTQDRYARIHGIARRGQEMGLAVRFDADKHFFEAMPIDRAVEELEKATSQR